MDKERILSAIEKLPEIPADKYPIEDDEIFEGDEHGGHFKFTRNFVEEGDTKISFYTLSVSGQLGSSRARIISDFTSALGREPHQLWYDKDSALHFVSWLIST